MKSLNLFKFFCFSFLLFTSIMGAKETPKISEQDKIAAFGLAKHFFAFLYSPTGETVLNVLSYPLLRDQLMQWKSDQQKANKKTVEIFKPMALATINEALKAYKGKLVAHVFPNNELRELLLGCLIAIFLPRLEVSEFVKSDIRQFEGETEKSLTDKILSNSINNKIIKNALYDTYRWLILLCDEKCFFDLLTSSYRKKLGV